MTGASYDASAMDWARRARWRLQYRLRGLELRQADLTAARVRRLRQRGRRGRACAEPSGGPVGVALDVALALAGAFTDARADAAV